MENNELIISLETRALSVGISINELCERAAVARSTYTRWKSKKTRPNMGTYQKFIDELAKEEAIAAKNAKPKKSPKN